VCVVGPTSHCRSLKRQRALLVPFINFRSELNAQIIEAPETQNHGPAFISINPGRFGRKTGPPRRPRQAPRAETPSKPKKPLRRHSAGGLVCPESGVTWPYLPHPIANTPVGHWWLVAGGPWRPPPTARCGLQSGAPQVQNQNLRPPALEASNNPQGPSNSKATTQSRLATGASRQPWVGQRTANQRRRRPGAEAALSGSGRSAGAGAARSTTWHAGFGCDTPKTQTQAQAHAAPF
jgi:hypothetical protein